MSFTPLENVPSLDGHRGGSGNSPIQARGLMPHASSLTGVTRKIESFTCEQCGASVKGDGYTNHCPKCLWSKHVDIAPGDRRAACRGPMRPVAARYVKDEYIIYHRCEGCGYEITNRASPSDSSELLISLTTNSIINQ